MLRASNQFPCHPESIEVRERPSEEREGKVLVDERVVLQSTESDLERHQGTHPLERAVLVLLLSEEMHP
jgi:hypothetical protein